MGTVGKKYAENLDKLIPFKQIEEMTEETMGAYVPWLFPSLGLAESESSWSTFSIHPLAPDKTKVIVRTKMEPMSDVEYQSQLSKSNRNWTKIMGDKTKYDRSDESDPMASGDFMQEDIYACEQQQKSLSNPLFSVIATAHYQESSVRGFQKIVKRWMNLSNL